jgi:hypothetical protein
MMRIQSARRPAHSSTLARRSTHRSSFRYSLSRRFFVVFGSRSLFALFLLAATVPSRGQLIVPHIGYAYPAGGRQGASFEVTLGGQFLDGATNAYVSGEGVQSVVLLHAKPLTPQQFNNLRERLKELQDKRQASMKRRSVRKRPGSEPSAAAPAWTAEEEQTFQELVRKLASYQRRPQNPAIGETVKIRVNISTNAEPGEHELRLRTAAGLSNPLVFCIGQVPEFVKKDPRSTQAPSLPRRPSRNNTELEATPPTEMNIKVPATINGQILQGGVDRFRFLAHKGQKLVIQANARSLIPYLADAVPGWFQATLTLYDSKGKEIAYDDDYQFRPDPVIYYEIPKDEEYLLEIKDAIYRGREDFVYRISIGESPFITGIFPLGGAAGTRTKVEVSGWNLPQKQIVFDATDKAPGNYSVCVRKADCSSTPVLFAVDSLPECLEREANNSETNAQPVQLPVIINGRVDESGDRDVFRFEGRAQDEIVAEVTARRLGSPVDCILTLKDSHGRQLAFNDDCEDKGSGLNTHHADSLLRARLPSDGAYFIYLTDAQKKGGSEYAYRLRISPPLPDFALRIAPSSINLRPGVSQPVMVYALRKDGFTNEIKLELADAPEGLRLDGGRIPAGQEQLRVTLTATLGGSRTVFPLTFRGRAATPKGEIVRQALPSEDMMQAFAYRHLVPAQELEVAIVGRGFIRDPVRIVGESRIRIPVGGTASVRLSGAAAALVDRIQLELSDPPEGLTLEKVVREQGKTELVLRGDASKLKPGLGGNLIVNVIPSGGGSAAQKTKKQGNARRRAVGTLPAIPFEIVAQ